MYSSGSGFLLCWPRVGSDSTDYCTRLDLYTCVLRRRVAIIIIDVVVVVVVVKEEHSTAIVILHRCCWAATQQQTYSIIYFFSLDETSVDAADAAGRRTRQLVLSHCTMMLCFFLFLSISNSC